MPPRHSRLMGLALACFVVACGDSASERRWRDYVRSDHYKQLVLEVDYVDGLQPASPPMHLTKTLEQIVDKPKGVVLRLDTVLAPSPGKSWTVDALEELMDETYDLAVPADAIKIHTVIVDGHYVDDTADGSVLGVSWDGRRIAIFAETIASVCSSVQGPLIDRVRACNGTTNSVWMHEIGHLLGLVGNGLPLTSDHQDPDPGHGNHDVSESCIMHWETNSSRVLERIKAFMALQPDERPLPFDDACLADLAAVRDAP